MGCHQIDMLPCQPVGVQTRAASLQTEPMPVDKLPPSTLPARPGHGGLQNAACMPGEPGWTDDRSASGQEGRLSLPDQARNRLSTLLAVVFLAIPVSALADLLDVRLGGVTVGLQALEYWALVALIAAACVCSDTD